MILRPSNPTRVPAYLPRGTQTERLMSRAADRDTERLADVGVLVTSAHGLVRTIRQLGVRNASGNRAGRILLAEGTYHLRDGITLGADYLELVALSPGKTVLRREAAGTTSLLTLAGRGCRVEGVTFQDTSTTAQYAVSVTGSHCEIRTCVFDDCWRAVHLSGTWARMSGCSVEQSRDTTYCVLASGADCAVMDNRLDGAGAGAWEVYASGTRALVAGNACGNGGQWWYDGRYSGCAVGNTPEKSVRTITSASSPYTVLWMDRILLGDCTGAALRFDLPNAATAGDMFLRCKKIDATANLLNVDGFGAQTIDGAAAYNVVAQYDSVDLWCDGTQWWIAGRAP